MTVTIGFQKNIDFLAGRDYTFVSVTIPTLFTGKKTKKSDPNWFGYLLTVKDDAGFTREDFVRHLEENKIQTRSYFAGNCLFHPAYVEYAKKYDDLKASFPNAYKATVNSFFLGTFIGITEDKVKYIKEITDEFFAKK